MPMTDTSTAMEQIPINQEDTTQATVVIDPSQNPISPLSYQLATTEHGETVKVSNPFAMTQRFHM